MKLKLKVAAKHKVVILAAVILMGLVVLVPSAWANENGVFDDDYTLTEDMVYPSRLLSGNDINLNGHTLTIEGDLIQEGGRISLNGGSLIVKGDYRIQKWLFGNEYERCYGVLEMKNENDYILVEGDFVTEARNSHGGNLLTGVLEVKGNFVQKSSGSNYSFDASHSHRVLLSGEGRQEISFESPIYSGFADLEATNPNIHFTTEFRGWTLKRDLSLASGIKAINGTMDLNGHKLNVNGDLVKGGGKMDINGGELKITGDYRIQNEISPGIYERSYGELSMTEAADYVLVEGDFVADSRRGHTDALVNGVLEVKGNFVQLSGGSHYNFNASHNHKVILSGEERQEISFESPSYSGFADLEATNQNIHFTTEFRGWTLKRDLSLASGIKGINGTMDLNGHKLAVNGDLIKGGGVMYINGGWLDVAGNYRIQQELATGIFDRSYGELIMTEAADYVLVKGDFIVDSRRGHTDKLINGVLEVKGDFEQKDNGSIYNFNAKELHTVVLSGDASQNVSFQSPNTSGFANLIIVNGDAREISYLTEDQASRVLTATSNIVCTVLKLAPQGTYEAETRIGEGAVTWESLNPNVATVSGNGLVTAVAEGTALIRINSAQNADDFLYAVVTVVTDPDDVTEVRDPLHNRPVTAFSDPLLDRPVDWATTVTFSMPVDIETVLQRNIYVTDTQDNVQPMFYIIDSLGGNDSKIIIRPVRDYTPGETYTLWICDIISRNGDVLTRNVYRTFTIAN